MSHNKSEPTQYLTCHISSNIPRINKKSSRNDEFDFGHKWVNVVGTMPHRIPFVSPMFNPYVEQNRDDRVWRPMFSLRCVRKCRARFRPQVFVTG